MGKGWNTCLCMGVAVCVHATVQVAVCILPCMHTHTPCYSVTATVLTWRHLPVVQGQSPSTSYLASAADGAHDTLLQHPSNQPGGQFKHIAARCGGGMRGRMAQCVGQCVGQCMR